MIKTFLKSSEFTPGTMAIFYQPFYFARKSLFSSIKGMAPSISGKILDVGCGQKPYKFLFNYSEYIGIDVEQEGHPHINEDVDIFYDGKILPFDSKSIDSVITTQVFEHVFSPSEFLMQINRVLKPGGKLLLTVPFVWDEHEQPFDYARYSSFGIRHVLELNGFQILQQDKTISDLRVIFQLFNTYVFKLSFSKGRLVKYLATILLIAPSNILGLIFSKLLPSNKDLYLDNVILAEKMVDV